MIMLHAGLAVSLKRCTVSFTRILSNCNAPVFLFILSWQENKKPLTESIIASRLTYCFFIPVFSINSTFVLSFTIDKYRWNSWIGLIKTEKFAAIYPLKQDCRIPSTRQCLQTLVISTVNPSSAGINFPFIFRNSIRVSTSI